VIWVVQLLLDDGLFTGGVGPVADLHDDDLDNVTRGLSSPCWPPSRADSAAQVTEELDGIDHCLLIRRCDAEAAAGAGPCRLPSECCLPTTLVCSSRSSATCFGRSPASILQRR